MSYQVLARKWRPATFHEMRGQEHVLQALINGLDGGRLHHAYLFTGTRGVGKTSVARILAKGLNCQQGPTSRPCGECDACLEIADNRFVDLIEVDAASRTKVEDTRELLENVQYAPTKGRFKIYLIDEVHMLSTHSFNALLKTLEEPPAHVKFLLATTDPQRLPATILSRCLQFSLKNLPADTVVEHLQHVLAAEDVPAEDEALWSIARAAAGSMRDALSLTDQAIAFGSGEVRAKAVADMLGSIDRGAVCDVIEALSARNAAALMASVESLSGQGCDFETFLAELMSALHSLAMSQAVPGHIDPNRAHAERLLALSQNVIAEDIQLYYQIALNAQRDMAYAPDSRVALEMALLRMLAFLPEQDAEATSHSEDDEQKKKPERQLEPQSRPETEVVAQLKAAPEPKAEPQPKAEPKPRDAHYSAGPDAETAATKADASALGADSLGADAPSPKTIEPAAAELPVQRAESGDASASEAFGQSSTQGVGRLSQRRELEGQGEPLDLGPQDSDPQDSDPLMSEPLISQPENAGSVVSKPGAGAAKPQTERQTKPQTEPQHRPPLEARWHTVFEALDIKGMTRNVASNCELVDWQSGVLQFILDDVHCRMFQPTHVSQLERAITEHSGDKVSVKIELGTVSGETPYRAQLRRREERQQAAIDSIMTDPNVLAMQELFGAQVDMTSITPRDN